MAGCATACPLGRPTCSATIYSRVKCVPEPCFSLADILVLAGTAGAGRMVPPTSTRIFARLQRAQEHSSHPGECPVPLHISSTRMPFLDEKGQTIGRIMRRRACTSARALASALAAAATLLASSSSCRISLARIFCIPGRSTRERLAR